MKKDFDKIAETQKHCKIVNFYFIVLVAKLLVISFWSIKEE